MSRGVPRSEQELCLGNGLKYNKLDGPVKNYFQLADYPADTAFSVLPGSHSARIQAPTTSGVGAMGLKSESNPWQPFLALRYFSAPNRADSRDLYREAVFSCRMPFWIALSSNDTVCR